MWELGTSRLKVIKIVEALKKVTACCKELVILELVTDFIGQYKLLQKFYYFKLLPLFAFLFLSSHNLFLSFLFTVFIYVLSF